MTDKEYVRDFRIDKMLTWVLTFFCGVALSIGAWFFSGLSTELGKLREAVGELKTEVRVQAERERRVVALEQFTKTLDDRVRHLESR
jgi:hypothetical protein